MSQAMIDVEKFADATNQAIARLHEFFKNPGLYDGKVAAVATSVVSSWTRHLATISERQRTDFVIGRTMFDEDKKALKDYLQSTRPDLPLVKKLKSGK